MKLDRGTMLVLAVLLSLPGLIWVPGMVGFWCMFIVIYDVFKDAAERHDREEQEEERP